MSAEALSTQSGELMWPRCDKNTSSAKTSPCISGHPYAADQRYQQRCSDRPTAAAGLVAVRPNALHHGRLRQGHTAARQEPGAAMGQLDIDRHTAARPELDAAAGSMSLGSVVWPRCDRNTPSPQSLALAMDTRHAAIRLARAGSTQRRWTLRSLPGAWHSRGVTPQDAVAWPRCDRNTPFTLSHFISLSLR